MRAQALILLLGILLIGPVAWAAEPIVLGEINPLTGALALPGQSVHQRIILAVEEQNTRVRIWGRPVTLPFPDDNGKPERALAAAEELAGRGGGVSQRPRHCPSSTSHPLNP
jgi:ABC-type branched-subunit amino acid transport system substrate-binding protein